jgi:predicted acyltransferase
MYHLNVDIKIKSIDFLHAFYIFAHPYFKIVMHTIQPSSTRLISLDAFRGFTIVAMIIVNNPGSWQHVYAPLLHAKWHGITPTDLIFPFFLYIMGVSIALSYAKQLEKGVALKIMSKKILKRGLIIFALGVFLYLFPTFNITEDIRWAGVLQRIAIVFVVCAFMYLFTSWRFWIGYGLAILLMYWMFLMLIPVPGIGTGFLEPGKNLANWIDDMFLPGMLWEGTWDPEGLLSTLPATVTCVMGMLAGHYLHTRTSDTKRVIFLFFSGFCCFVTGVVWDWFFPINKNLWTSSFVLYTGGLASMSLAFFYHLIDVLKYQKWAKAGLIFGANAITAYVLAGMLARLLSIPLAESNLKNMTYQPMMRWMGNAELASLAWALVFCFICFLPTYWLYQKKIFIKV